MWPPSASIIDWQIDSPILLPSGFPAPSTAPRFARQIPEVVGIFPNEAALTRLIGTLLLEQNDEWAVQRARHMTLETIAPMSNDPIVRMPALAI
jgi:hypothetical protein